jgi:hypothetical protein
MTVPYPGYGIVEAVYMKYKYIELCYYYAGSTYFYGIKMIICVLSNSLINLINTRSAVRRVWVSDSDIVTRGFETLSVQYIYY